MVGTNEAGLYERDVAITSAGGEGQKIAARSSLRRLCVQGDVAMHASETAVSHVYSSQQRE